MFALPGRALRAVTALQLQDNILDSRLDGNRKTALPHLNPGEAACVTAGDDEHPFYRSTGPLRWNRVPRRGGEPSYCLARYGE